MEPVVVIDVGHGGRDPGTTAGGMREADVQLKVALATRVQLLARYEVTVVLTRDTDREVFQPAPAKYDLAKDLQARCDITHKYLNSVLFSFHHNNSGGDPIPRGFEQYIYGPSEVSYDPATGQYAPRSFALAQRLAPVLKERMEARGLRYNGIKFGNFHVTRETNRPAVLLEAGYASSPYDAGHMTAPGWVEYLAETYTLAIAAALNLKEREVMWGDKEALYVKQMGVIDELPQDLDKPITYRWALTVIAKLLSRKILKDGRF